MTHISSIDVREARLEDVDAIADVSLRSRKFARRGVYADAYLDGLTRADAETAALGYLEREGWRTWVAELAGRIVAYSTAGPWSHDPAGKTADVDELYVDPNHFRRGIGSQVLRHVEAELVTGAYEAIMVWVRDGDAAVEAFYSAQDFHRQEQTKQLVKDRSRSFRLWTKQLPGEPNHVDPR